MERRWRSRAVEVPVSMTAVRRMWRRAWRVDGHVGEPTGIRRTTVLLCAEPPGADRCTPIGWVSVRWSPETPEGVIDRLGWDAAATEPQAWRAMTEMAGAPIGGRAADRRSAAA